MTFRFKLLLIYLILSISGMSISGCVTSSGSRFENWDKVNRDRGYKQQSAYWEAANKKHKESQSDFEKARGYAEKQMCNEALAAYKKAEVNMVWSDTYRCYSSQLDPFVVGYGMYEAICNSRQYHLINRANARVKYRSKICDLKQDPMVGPFFLNNSSDANYQEGVDFLNKKEVNKGVMSLSLAAYTGSTQAAYALGHHYLGSGNADKAVHWFAVSSMLSDGRVGQWELTWGELAHGLSRQKKVNYPLKLDYIFALDKTESNTNDIERKFLINLVNFCGYDFDYDSGQFKPLPETVRLYSNYSIEKFQKLAIEGYQPAKDIVAVLLPWSEETQDVKKQARLCGQCQKKYWYPNATELLTPWLKAYRH